MGQKEKLNVHHPKMRMWEKIEYGFASSHMWWWQILDSSSRDVNFRVRNY